MLLALHNTLQQLIYQRGQISPGEVDITFEAPTRERIDTLTRPTINVFLFDVVENIELRQSDFQTTRNSNGHIERRLLPRRFDLRYMISALTTAIEDEHALLWRVLLTLVQHPQFPVELLSDDLRAMEPPVITRVCQDEESQRLSGIWTALGVPPHPTLSYVVTVPLDIKRVIEAPLVLTRTARYRHMYDSQVAVETGNQIGGVIRSEQGRPLMGVKVAIEGSAASDNITNSEGYFVLRGVPSGTIRLLITREDGSQKIVALEVPGPHSADALNGHKSSYDIVLDSASSKEA